jgi:flagellar biosynthetic protein FliP
VSLALFLTLFTMTPVIEEMNRVAFDPYSAGEITTLEAAQKALVPLRGFMIRQTREKDMALVIELSGKPRPTSMEQIETTTLIPAFMLSELQTAFQIGFVIFLPFLLIDLISASVLMAMGMIMVPPLTIALPIKVLMFVLIEGWALVAKALVGSFA